MNTHLPHKHVPVALVAVGVRHVPVCNSARGTLTSTTTSEGPPNVLCKMKSTLLDCTRDAIVATVASELVS